MYRTKEPKISDRKETKKQEEMKMTNRKKEAQTNGQKRKNEQ